MEFCFNLQIFNIFLTFLLKLYFSYGNDICKTNKIRIYDKEKFPNSSFSHYLEYNNHIPEEVRIIPNGTISAWHTVYYNAGWVQVDLGNLFYFYFYLLLSLF